MAASCARYNPRVFILPPWQDIYCTDAERTHSWDEAVNVYHIIKQAYQDAGYSILEVPPAPVTERVAFVMGNVR